MFLINHVVVLKWNYTIDRMCVHSGTIQLFFCKHSLWKFLALKIPNGMSGVAMVRVGFEFRLTRTRPDWNFLRPKPASPWNGFVNSVAKPALRREWVGSGWCGFANTFIYILFKISKRKKKKKRVKWHVLGGIWT